MFDRTLNTPLNLDSHIVVKALDICLKILKYYTSLAFKSEELSNFNVLLVALFVVLKSFDFSTLKLNNFPNNFHQ